MIAMAEERTSSRWNDRYVDGDLPWDSGEVDQNLLSILANVAIDKGAALEVGCGTGTNAIALARHGFASVTATDFAPRAVELAKEKALKANVTINFHVHDFINNANVPGTKIGTLDFVFDRGVFHSVTDGERKRFAAHVAQLLRPGGWWLSLCGSADDTTPGGPPRLTATHIAMIVEPLFEIHGITRERFRDVKDEHDSVYMNWRVLLRKRLLNASTT